MKMHYILVVWALTASALSISGISGFAHPQYAAFVPLICLALGASSHFATTVRLPHQTQLQRLAEFCRPYLHTILPMLFCSWLYYLLYKHLIGYLDFATLGECIVYLLGLFGCEAQLHGDVIHANSGSDMIAFAQTPEYYGTYFLGNFVVNVVVSWWILGMLHLENVVKLIVSVFVYGILRYLAAALIYLQYKDIYSLRYPSTVFMFYDAIPCSLSFVALPIAMMFFSYVKPRTVPRCLNIYVLATKSVAILVGILIFGFILTYEPSTVRKEGRVIIDDFHSGTWERVGTGSFSDLSPESLYSYSALPAVLAKQFKVTTFNGPSLAGLSHHSCDVLILKTPFIPFSPEEVIAIQKFVEDGGGLLIIADHTDLLGLTTNTNRLIHKWGISLNNDACNQLSDGLFTRYYPDSFAEHHVMRGIKLFSFLTSCTIRVETTHASIVIPALDVFSDPGNYGQPNFFGDMCPRPGQRFGVLPLCVSEDVGRGRIVVFSDGTPFSNFALFFDGHITFLRNCLDYLNSKPMHLLFVHIAISLCAIALVLYCFLTMSRIIQGHQFIRSLLLVATFSVFTGGLSLGQYMSARNIGRDEPSSTKSYNWVTGFGDIRFPPVIGIPLNMYNMRTAYNSLLVSSFADGFTPNIVSSTQTDVAATDYFVVPVETKERVPQAIAWLTKCAQTTSRKIVVLTDRADIKLAITSAINDANLFAGGTLLSSKQDGQYAILNYRVRSGTSICVIHSTEALSDELLGNPMDQLSETQLERRKQLSCIWKQFL